MRRRPAIHQLAKVTAEHAREPSLTHADLRTISTRTLVLIAADDEVRLEHAIEMHRSLGRA